MLEASDGRVLLGVAIGLGANVVAEALLIRDPHMRRVCTLCFVQRRTFRIARWSVSSLVLALLSGFGLTAPVLIAIALFTVTAATDFECRTLPPDWFIYGAVVAGVLAHGLSGGLDGLATAAATQAMCFALTTISVLVLRNTDPGDIKAMMQFGAACGSLSVMLVTVLGQAAVSAAVVSVAWLFTRRIPRHLPLATLMWAGLVLVPLMSRVVDQLAA